MFSILFSSLIHISTACVHMIRLSDPSLSRPHSSALYPIPGCPRRSTSSAWRDITLHKVTEKDIRKYRVHPGNRAGHRSQRLNIRTEYNWNSQLQARPGRHLSPGFPRPVLYLARADQGVSVVQEQRGQEKFGGESSDW